ncbi:MAG: hypothetical protein LAQ69_33505 [Acidobacteriia bacterium]|nr:hypothetical protein [Terriglobia bacterium]
MKTVSVCFLLGVVMVATAAAADVNGKWSGSFTPENGNNGTAYLVLKQSGTTITGTAGPDESQQWPIQTGKIQGDKVSVVVKSTGDGTVYKCEVVLAGEHLQGDCAVAQTDGQSLKAKLDLTRVK